MLRVDAKLSFLPHKHSIRRTDAPRQQIVDDAQTLLIVQTVTEARNHLTTCVHRVQWRASLGYTITTASLPPLFNYPHISRPPILQPPLVLLFTPLLNDGLLVCKPAWGRVQGGARLCNPRSRPCLWKDDVLLIRDAPQGQVCYVSRRAFLCKMKEEWRLNAARGALRLHQQVALDTVPPWVIIKGWHSLPHLPPPPPSLPPSPTCCLLFLVYL